MVVARRAVRLMLGAAAAMTLAIGLSACSSTATTDEDGSGTGENGAQSGTASVPPTASGTHGWQVSPMGIGPFEIGMRYADALTVPNAEVSELCTGVAQISVPEHGDMSMWVIASEHDPTGTLSEISISAPSDSIDDTSGGPETEKEIGLGSTVAELTEAYPESRELDDTDVLGRIMYYVQAGDAGMIFTTTAESGVIWQISITTGETPAYEPCA